MKYADASAAIFACGTVPNGFNGHTVRVGYALDRANTRILEVASCGYYRSHLPPASSQEEAFELLLADSAHRVTDVCRCPHGPHSAPSPTCKQIGPSPPGS